ncbi:MAG TPA: 3-deoxy-D-manno-octulosonate 8-phosphate phosphatase [Nitrospirae bacterium]|nr:3-deoxy-D-manno-octulosonate 8-phosphate phosphatase [Nitrospirota bacterium]
MSVSPKDINLLVFDFDGVFTDNSVYVFEDGRETVRCCRADGLGISKLVKRGLDMIILSTEINSVVQSRAKKLKLECINGLSDKYEALLRLSEDKGINLLNIAYVGNDINDLECLKAVGLPIVVADAMDDVKNLGARVTKAKGGYGAVREVCDWFDDELNK